MKRLFLLLALTQALVACGGGASVNEEQVLLPEGANVADLLVDNLNADNSALRANVKALLEELVNTDRKLMRVASAAGGTSQRLKPGPAMVFSLSKKRGRESVMVPAC